MIYGMIREHLKSTNGIYLYYYLKYIKTECTFEDVIYKMCIFFYGDTSSPDVRPSK